MKCDRFWRVLSFAFFFLIGVLPVGAQQRQRTAGPSYDDQGLLRINMDAYALSAGTGGDFYFWAPGEFAGSALQIPIEREPILLAYGSLDRPRTFSFPIDTATETLSVFSGAQRKNAFSLMRPSGIPVAESDAGVHLQEFKHILIVRVTQPERGTWRVELQGAGRFSLSVRSGREAGAPLTSDRPEPLSIVGFDFVERGGRPGHEGYFPITGSVKAGERRQCLVNLSGAYESADFAFVSAEGELLRRLNLARVGPDETTPEFFGHCEILAKPFRLRVKGRDARGLDYQRMHSPLYIPENEHKKTLQQD